MTQKSYYHNGTITGDALLAPYTKDDVRTMVDDLYAPTGGGIIYGHYYSSSGLDVNRTNATTLAITGGVAIYNGYLVYLFSSTSITVSRTCTGPYWIRVVLGMRSGKPYIMTINGTDHSNPPEIPSLETVFQYHDAPEGVISLARVYVPAAGDIIQAAYIFDERVFIQSPEHYADFVTENLFPNSELLASNNVQTVYSSGQKPVFNWYFSSMTGSVTVAQYGGTFIKYERCKPLLFKSTGAFVLDTGYVGLASANNTNYTKYFATTQFYVRVIKGSLTLSDGATVVNTFLPSNEPQLIIYRNQYNAATRGMNLTFTATDVTEFVIGQITTTYGYIVAPFMPIKEFIPFQISSPFSDPLTDDNTALLERFSMVDAHILFTDAACAGVDVAFMELCDPAASGSIYLRIEEGRLTNGTTRTANGPVHINRVAGETLFDINVTAVGGYGNAYGFIGAMT